MADLDGNDFVIDNFHVAFEKGIEILNPWFVDVAGDFGGFEELLWTEHEVGLVVGLFGGVVHSLLGMRGIYCKYGVLFMFDWLLL